MSYIKHGSGIHTLQLKQIFHSNKLLHCLSGLGELRELVECKGSEFVIVSSISG